MDIDSRRRRADVFWPDFARSRGMVDARGAVRVRDVFPSSVKRVSNYVGGTDRAFSRNDSGAMVADPINKRATRATLVDGRNRFGDDLYVSARLFRSACN